MSILDNLSQEELKQLEEYKTPDNQYLIPVSWTEYSTIKIQDADNLRDAIEIAENNINKIPCNNGQYLDGSYAIDIQSLDDATNAQDYQSIGDVTVYKNGTIEN